MIDWPVLIIFEMSYQEEVFRQWINCYFYQLAYWHFGYDTYAGHQAAQLAGEHINKPVATGELGK
mgnify:CR=1 FL=1